MAGKDDHPKSTGWQRLDGSAFALIYGSVMVLSILLATGAHPGAPFETGIVLFGSVLAITLAKAFAELMAHALDTGERIDRKGWAAAWAHSYPTLAVANLPTLFFFASAAGWLSIETAILVSQALCIGLLAFLGARVGWVIDAKASSTVLGALFAGGIGVALSVLKVLIH